jgi:hypothetical protein
MRMIASLVLCFYFAGTLSADDLVVTEKSFGCVLDLPKVRNTRPCVEAAPASCGPRALATRS